ncbi:MAG: nucleotidyltransferase domain-containing protein [Deltaproteobacteria bacterium]|nr:nucleotidyltransferase domain-containing protein [Deltaproteobacteria bacterium]
MDKNHIDNILKELKNKLKKLYGEKLAGIILYGSYAKGKANHDSDIDIAIILHGKVYPGIEIDRINDLIYELNLKYNTLISIYPVSENSFNKIKSPLILNIHKEGINV